MSDFNSSNFHTGSHHASSDREGTAGASTSGNALHQAGIGQQMENAARWIWKKIRGSQS